MRKLILIIPISVILLFLINKQVNAGSVTTASLNDYNATVVKIKEIGNVVIHQFVPFPPGRTRKTTINEGTPHKPKIDIKKREKHIKLL